MFNRRLNLCKFTSVIENNVFFSLIFKYLAKSINTALTCPFPPRSYAIKDMPIEVPSFVSGAFLMIAENTQLCVDVKTFGNVEGDKRVYDFIFFSGKGKFVR